MKRLLVGFDGSPNAKGALRWAANVADPLGAELVAISAWSPRQAELPPREAEEEHRELDDILAGALAEEAPNLRGLRSEIVDGNAVDVLLERAEGEDVDLIVVGLRGAGGFRGLPLGSVADTLAHHTTRPLALVPDAPSLETRHIVLGVDGSDGASAAAQWCATFASGLQAEVTAANVYTQQLEVLTEHDPHSLFQYFEHALHTEWVTPLRDARVTVHPELLRAHHVADALVGEARRTNALTIVVGTHGLAPLIHLRLGGVTMQLLHTTTVPVIVVPPPR